MKDAYYVARLYRLEPETRWFRRVVLRRKTTKNLIYAWAPDRFELIRRLNAPDELRMP